MILKSRTSRRHGATAPARAGRGRRHGSALPVKVLVAVATVLTALVGTATVASAHHADVTATPACSDGVRTVVFTTTAWQTNAGAKARTNDQIEIAYSTNGVAGPFTRVKVDKFNSADHFTFGGSFVPNPDTSGTTITVRAVALVKWADHGPAGNPHYATAILPADCTGPVPTATLTAACSSTTGDATAHLVITNPAATDQTFEVAINGAKPIAVVVPAGSSGSLDRPFTSPLTFAITDAALGFSTTKTTPAGFSCAPPTVKMTVTCNTTGPAPVENAHLVVTNNASSKQTFIVTINTAVQSLVLAPGSVGTVDKSFSPGSPPTFKVTDSALAFAVTPTVTEVSCVLSTQVTPPTTEPSVVKAVSVAQSASLATGTLPATGTDPLPLGEVALALLLAGALTVGATYRRPRVPAGKHFRRA